jgi:hypothetical protein
MKLWSSAVTYLNVQPSEAWNLTPFEFWALWDTHLEKMEISTGKAYTRPMTMDEFNELSEFLDELHGDN